MRHLYALVVGFLIAGGGWFLAKYETACRDIDGMPLKASVWKPYGSCGPFESVYGYRSFGIALIALAAVFCSLVLRDSFRNTERL